MKLPESTREKSLLLAQAMGDGWLPVEEADEGTQEAFEPFGANMLFRVGGTYAAHVIDLYAPGNMALAWQVLNWAQDKKRPDYFNKDFGRGIRGSRWNWGWDIDLKELVSLHGLHDRPPAEAQAAWLDKILKLAIEAGLVEVS